MPTGTGVGGYASANNTTLTTVGGDASIDDSALALGVGGDASVDVTEAQAWTQREWGRVRVVIDGEDVTSLVGTVDWERSCERAAHYATFTLADARVAYAHASSFSDGSKAVRIYRYTASRGGEDEELVFRGRTEAPSNSEPILPTGTFRCVSDASVYDEPRACLRLGAFAGYTRAQILTDLAASAGLTVTIPGGWGETVVRKPVEYVNVSVFEIARRFCEIEGGWPRSTVEGLLEIVAEDSVYGPAIWSFDETNSFTPSEEPPQRPPTRWVLSGTAISLDYSGDEETGSGETITEEVSGGIRDGKAWETRRVVKDSGSGATYGITGFNGQIEEIVEEYDTFAPLGTTSPAEAFDLWKRTTTRTLFTTYGYQGRTRTSRIERRVTKIEEWYSPLSNKDGELWTDGSHHVDAAQTFRETQRIVEVFDWNDSDEDPPCVLNTITTTVRGYYGHADGDYTGTYADAGGGTESYTEDTSKAFDDGNSYDYGGTHGEGANKKISETVETWSAVETAGLRSVKREKVVTGWAQTRGEYRRAPYRYGPLEEYDEIGTDIERWVQSALPGVHVRQTIGLDGSYSSENVNGEIPEIPKADGESPAFQQDVISIDGTDAGSLHPYLVESETIPEAESVDELEAVWRRRMRRANVVRHTIPAPDEKWLNVGESVTETDAARSMTDWIGPVEQMRVGVDVLSGFGVAEFVVALEEP